MSASSSILNTIREVPTTDTINTEHQINLVDQERGEDNRDDEDAERNYSEAPTAAEAETPKSPLKKTLTRNSSQLQQSLKRQWTKRKYAKYDRERYDLDEGDDATDAPEEDASKQSQIGDAATAAQTSYLERSRAKAKNMLLRRKRTMGTAKHDQDSVIDILYENQRGVFLFGIPKYSSSSLLPSDPAPWQNHQFRTSPVDIRNAQVPDPSWEWGWKSWYVDMSRDVDEEGWEYSFKFTGGFAWHGNHPWFHSFVRRRRWLRLRRRRDPKHHTKEKSHELTEEYFTIHPKTLRPRSEDLSRAGSEEMDRLREKLEEEEDLKDAEKMDITDIGSLIHILKRSGVDREKQVAVRKFVDSGGEELYYLADRMEEIMNLFIYQTSRRQLLSCLLQRFDQAYARRQSLTEHQHDDEDTQREHDKAAQQADNLMNAVKAADAQVKKLEFWSDIKDMSHKGETLQREEGRWNAERWQGLSPTTTGPNVEEAFASKQAASEGAPELHRHPEHPSRPSLPTTTSGKGKQKENVRSVQDDDSSSKSAVTAPSKKSTATSGSRVLAVKHPIGGGKESSASEAEGYYTSAESASELPTTRQKLKERGKSQMSSHLDGVTESIGEDADNNPEDNDNFLALTDTPSTKQPNIPSRTQSHSKPSVQIVEPVPEPADDRQAGGRGGGGDGS